MKRPQTKFHAQTMRESQVIKSKKSKLIIRSQFLLFIGILLKLQQQISICFCKCCCNSVIVMGMCFRT